MKANLLSITCLLWAPICVHGSLVFKQPHQSFHPNLIDESVDTVFHFVNNGESPITIQDIKTSCGCTTAALGKKTYLPGESGDIQTTFTIGNRQGLQRKHIRVQTNDTENSEIFLTMEVIIPVILEITPRFVSWSKGDTTETKKVTLTSAEATPVNITSIISKNSNFEIKLNTIETGKQYELWITPLSTENPQRSLITIETTINNNAISKTLYVHAFVR